MPYSPSGDQSLSPWPRVSSVTTRNPCSARTAPVAFHECRVWPPPCSISTVEPPGEPQTSAASITPSLPAKRRVSGAGVVIGCCLSLADVRAWGVPHRQGGPVPSCRPSRITSTYIRMTADLAVGGEWSERVARERLAADLVELPGSHSPFYSRPAELAEILVRL